MAAVPAVLETLDGCIVTGDMAGYGKTGGARVIKTGYPTDEVDLWLRPLIAAAGAVGAYSVTNPADDSLYSPWVEAPDAVVDKDTTFVVGYPTVAAGSTSATILTACLDGQDVDDNARISFNHKGAGSFLHIKRKMLPGGKGELTMSGQFVCQADNAGHTTGIAAGAVAGNSAFFYVLPVGWRPADAADKVFPASATSGTAVLPVATLVVKSGGHCYFTWNDHAAAGTTAGDIISFEASWPIKDTAAY